LPPAALYMAAMLLLPYIKINHIMYLDVKILYTRF
jgi:hypothetical protein